MRRYFALALIAATAATAQPVIRPPMGIDPMLTGRRIAPLSQQARSQRAMVVLKPYSGSLGSTFKVAVGQMNPPQLRSLQFMLVRGMIIDNDGSLVHMDTRTLQESVDVRRPMITMNLKAHAKPYLADCSVGMGGSAQLGYLVTGTPIYHQTFMAKKNVLTPQDGHALFAIAPSAAEQFVMMSPTTLSGQPGWSMYFDGCELTEVG